MKKIINLPLVVGEWTKNKLTFRSSCFTGRGPSTEDLNSEMLEGIYQGIKTDVGKKEAKNFVNFVANLEDLSASAFIQSFEEFWYGGCKEIATAQEEGLGDRLTGRSEDELSVECIALIGNALSGHRMNARQIMLASLNIKNPFLFNHKKEIADSKALEHLEEGYVFFLESV